MNDRVFLDTNILVYSHTDVDVNKQAVAQNLTVRNLTFISTQVLQEMANILNRKFKHTWSDIEGVLINATENSHLHANNPDTIIGACQLAQRWNFSFYDSLIISAALECDCSILFSEDLSHGQIINKKLKIVNPFL